jgi:hypothetical protein
MIRNEYRHRPTYRHCSIVQKHVYCTIEYVDQVMICHQCNDMGERPQLY